MPYNMSLTFLGTSSGGGPTESRSCSSLVLDIQGNDKLWMVDCAEGTLRQFTFQKEPKTLKVNKVNKLFITHMHFDHCMGIISLLANLLRGAPNAEAAPSPRLPVMELYGPAGLRNFVRTILKMTSTVVTERYVVHELLTAQDALTSCSQDDLFEGESAGSDIFCDAEGFWREFMSSGPIDVDAGPIVHRAPCIGYVFRETTDLKRKIVILGDTSDPSAITELAQDASLLVHEATDTYIPVEVDRYLSGKNKKTPESVRQNTIAKGHSTAGMAGAFAKSIHAKRLFLNHISAKFPPSNRGHRRDVIAEIERQASEAWAMGEAHVAYDFMRVEIPAGAGGPNGASIRKQPTEGFEGSNRRRPQKRRKNNDSQGGRGNPPNPAQLNR